MLDALITNTNSIILYCIVLSVRLIIISPYTTQNTTSLQRVSVNPKEYLIPLFGNKAGLYRILYSRDDERIHVLVVKVKHRCEVYRQ